MRNGGLDFNLTTLPRRKFTLGYRDGFDTIGPVSPKIPARQRRKGPPPGETGQESLYLRFLSEKQVPVTVKLRDGESVNGWIEYFDDRMIRLTREGKPNLFIYKHQIRTISESFRNIEARRRERNRSGVSNAATLDASIAVVADAAPTLALVHHVASPGVEDHSIDGTGALESVEEPADS